MKFKKLILLTILILLVCGDIGMATPDRRPLVLEDVFLNSHAVIIQNMREEDDLLGQSEPDCRSCFRNYIRSIVNCFSRFIDSCLEPPSSIPVEQQRMYHLPPY